MVGKKELLGWVSDMCGRPVVSFSELKDGDALVRCVKETWPLAYDELRPRFPKRMDGTRDPKENFELIKAIFAKIGLPPEALDTRGVRASAFKPCYNFLVVCFFLRNLALHSDFSVDFTHPVDQTLAQFLQSPASVASLRRGGALPPSPDKGAEKNLKAERRQKTTPRSAMPNDAVEKRVASAEKGAKKNQTGAERSTPGLGAVFRPPSSSRGSRGNEKKLSSRKGGKGVQNAFPADVATPERSAFSRKGETRVLPSAVARRTASDSLGRFMRRRGAGVGGVEGTSRGDGDVSRGDNDVSLATENVEPTPKRRDEDDDDDEKKDDDDDDERRKRTETKESIETMSAKSSKTTTRHSDLRSVADDDSDLASRLASARFETEGLRRVVRGLKSERDDVVTRYEAELDALRAQSAADAESIRAAEKRRQRELESRFAEERAEDQRAFLRELRAVADEFSTVHASTPARDLVVSRDEDGENLSTASARRRVALEFSRGREIAALETRVRTLESEREGLLVDLAAATREDDEDDDGEGDENKKESTIRRLRSDLRLAEARHVADASSRAREIDELRVELRVARAELSDAKHAQRFVSSAVHDKDAGDVNTNAQKKSTFSALLGEHRDARRVARLEAEAKQAADVAAALRRQVDALVLDEGTPAKTSGTADLNGTGTKPASTPTRLERDEDETGDHDDQGPDDDSHAAALDAAAVLRAVAVLRDLALEPPSADGGEEVAAETAAAVTAAARAAEAAAWRRAAAAAVSRRRLIRARAAAASARARVVSLETKARDAEAIGAEREESLRRRARDAEEDLARERAAGGVRAALAEEAERLARSEAEEARREAAEARASALAAHGASAGALRDARDVAAKLRLRERHWVALVECHREAASASRAIAERVSDDKDSTKDTGGLAARAELETIAARRVELEAEAATHAEAIEAVAAMLPEDIHSGVVSKRRSARLEGDAFNRSIGYPNENESETLSHELKRLEARASAAERDAEALRVRLAKKTEDAAALALRAKRHELRAEEAAKAAEAGARERREAAERARRKQAETEETARRFKTEASRARNEASAAKAALEDRDAALDVGVALVRADPQLARSMMRRRSFGVSSDVSSSGEEEDIARTESEGFRGFSFPFGEKRNAVPNVQTSETKKSPPRSASYKRKSARMARRGENAAVALTSPEAVAAAVAEATRAIATTPGSVESRAFGSARTTSRDEPFADLDDVVSPLLRKRASSKKTFSKSPGGESVGSVGGAATPGKKGFFAPRTFEGFDVASARDVDDAVDALARDAADSVTPARSPPPVPASPFRRFLDVFSPRRVVGNGGSPPNAATLSVEEETEDSEATDSGASVVRDEGELPKELTFASPSPRRADTATAGLTSSSPKTVNSVSVSAVTSLPGGSTFVRDAEAHLAIEVKKSWFGLRDEPGEANESERSPSSKRAEK